MIGCARHIRAGAAIAGSGGVAPPSGPMATMGCTAPNPNQPVQTWLANKITVANLPADQVAGFGQRSYFVRLPVAYDHSKAYPVVFYGPGCGASSAEATPMMDQIKKDAIHVFLLQKSQCFNTAATLRPRYRTSSRP